jgi:CheY-like chemotaxis protein
VHRSGARWVILVVEDEWIVRSAIAQELRRAGWDVLEAGSGEAALACLQGSQRVDVIFTDIQLGGQVSGWDVAEHCRSAGRDMRIIYMSGNTVDRSRRVAGSQFFDKPYRLADIVDACRNAS